jgi:hypothetical protein
MTASDTLLAIRPKALGKPRLLCFVIFNFYAVCYASDYYTPFHVGSTQTAARS